MQPVSDSSVVQQNYWLESGYRLLLIDADSQLCVTDDFLRHLLARPELAPIADSCAHEVDLHHKLLLAPRQEIGKEVLDAIRDSDAAENYRVWLRFRDRLLESDTLEACYMAFFHGTGVDVAPVLVEQLTQVLVRHVLGNRPTAMEARTAEMLFRTQKISVQEDGSVMSADHETVERHAVSGGFGSVGELLKQGGIPLRTVDLDVLGADNADLYWQRDACFDMVLSLNFGQESLHALCRVMERWVRHFLNVEVRIQTDREIVDEHWVWHVGLDAQASSILNDLYTGADVDEDRMRRLMCLFKLEFVHPTDMLAEIAGKPVYLAMAMNEKQQLKIKPQNLLINLPLARRS